MKYVLIIIGFIFLVNSSFAQPKPGNYRAILYREDGKEVVFKLKIERSAEEVRVFILNATEKIPAKDIVIKEDSMLFNMPVFESSFRLQFKPDGTLSGTWIKGIASGKTQYWPFKAFPGNRRFELAKGAAKNNISGRWSVTITRAQGTTRPAIAEFIQKGNELTGTFLTPSGDYRYLEGIVTGDSLLLSTFDGAHAFTFSGKIKNRNEIIDGFFGSGIGGTEKWIAQRDSKAALPGGDAPQLKEGFKKLDFVFNDIDGNKVSIADERFKNKVVIVQIMGSWCPNCLDETKFLSDYYDKNRNRDIEIISLAYEYSTDFAKSQKSVRKFQNLFNVKYPMLITGVAVNDTLRTEKTLPQITTIKAFPTTIFLDRNGNVHKISSSFYGPGSGQHYENFKKEFQATIEELLNQTADISG
ncbi:MAG: peroxiredoxin family protein [Chitinophagaceae bacterium]